MHALAGHPLPPEPGPHAHAAPEPVSPTRLSGDGPAFSALAAIKELVRQWFVPKPDLLRLPTHARKEILACETAEEMLSFLADWRLLTPFQARRILAGDTSGLLLGNYRVLDLLGRGVSLVYRGEHRSLRMPVAIKVLPYKPDQDPRVVSRFRQEIATVARISHPHIVTVIDMGGASPADDGGTVLHYFVMEYLHGHDLEQYLRLRGVPAVHDVCRWGMQLASALAEAQRHGLVHRDIKPANVFIAQDGRAKLLDFGLALRSSNLPGTAGQIVGSIDYMAPEQFEDPYRVDGRADLYALGAVLYRCLTGKKPFPSEGRMFVDLAQRLTLPPPSPRAVRPEVPREVDLLVRRLMMLRPEDRFDLPHDAARILRKYASR